MCEKDRMIQTQAEMISKFYQYKKDLDKQITRLEIEVAGLRPAHDYYMLIQKFCLENETVMNEWQSFIVTLRLAIERNVETEINSTVNYYLDKNSATMKTIYDPEFLAKPDLLNTLDQVKEF